MTVTTGLRLFGAALFVVAVVFVFLFLGEQKIAKLKTNGVQTTAVITNALAVPGGRRYRSMDDTSYNEPARYLISYSFSVNGVEHLQTKDLGLRAFLNFQKGARIPIWYDPANPKIHSLDPSMNYSNLYLIAAIAGLAFASIAFIVSFRTSGLSRSPVWEDEIT